MASQATTSLAALGTKAAALLAKVQNGGVNVADPKEVVANAKELISLLDETQPHINRAQQAFGGQEQAISQANDLRNKLNRVIATYTS